MRRQLIAMILFLGPCFLTPSACSQERQLESSQESGNSLNAERQTGQTEDVSKLQIERPLERLVAEASRQAIPKNRPVVADYSKALIEVPVEELVATSDAVETNADSTTLNHTSQPSEDNPKCLPGLVNWHADFATACSASRKSGKPVMLFQLLGQLDHQFT